MVASSLHVLLLALLLPTSVAMSSFSSGLNDILTSIEEASDDSSSSSLAAAVAK